MTSLSRVTLKDVAARAGVSYQTVSKVINGQGTVGRETEELIWQVVAELGYRTNVTARSLRKQATGLIGYTWTPMPPDRANPILDRFLTGTMQAAEAVGYHLMLFPSPSSDEQVNVYRQLIHSGRVDGFIVASTNYDDPRIKLLMELNFPFVAFGRANPDWDFCYVDIDGRAGVRAATEHLLAQGHRSIAVIAWPGSSRVGTSRFAGYQDAMAAGGIEVLPQWVARAESSFADGYSVMQGLLALPPDERPTAVVAIDDNLAMGAMRAVQDAGIAVGSQLGITGFDDTPGVQHLSPPLTSVRQPILEVAQTLVPMLFQLIDGRRPDPDKVILEPRLIVRASSLRSAEKEHQP
jgi:DNA-binding LacI/PurR family transcriptional regulator